MRYDFWRRAEADAKYQAVKQERLSEALIGKPNGSRGRTVALAFLALEPSLTESDLQLYPNPSESEIEIVVR